jgi:hypothetical protein
VEVNVTTDVFNMALLALPESPLSGSVLFLALLQACVVLDKQRRQFDREGGFTIATVPG